MKRLTIQLDKVREGGHAGFYCEAVYTVFGQEQQEIAHNLKKHVIQAHFEHPGHPVEHQSRAAKKVFAALFVFSLLLGHSLRFAGHIFHELLSGIFGCGFTTSGGKQPAT